VSVRTKQVVICDDHEIIRDALRLRINRETDLEVAGETGDGEAVLEVVRELEPDLAIIDVEMPGIDGIAATAELRKRAPALKVLILSAHEQPELIDLARGTGAHGFVSKADPASEVARAARAVLAGGEWFPARGAEAGDELERLRSLTPREREILELFATGMRARGVAKRIGIQPATVYTHVRNAIHKLGVDSRTQAVAIATRFSFLSLDQDRKSDESDT
jgi:DNA-binding NarL/FixJ family response regulator